MKKFLIFLLLLFSSVIPFKIVLANFSDVVINEIAWMGTIVSANDEWLELYNNTENPITLNGWALKATDNTPEIELTGIIPANGFYLLERTDDTTVPDIVADLIYKGALGNDGEDLKLYDSSNNLIDEVDCSIKWFAGNNTTKQTMETLRQAQGESRAWQTSQNPGGTPREGNNTGIISNFQLPPISSRVLDEVGTISNETQNLNENLPEALPREIYPDNIVFNEILPSPEGPDEIEEWIEIYNQNDFEVNLSGWRIKDNEGKVTTYTFPDNAKIEPNNYLVLTRPVTKITLNNTGDKLTLLQPAGKITDTAIYEKAPQDQSYNRINADWSWSSILTPGLVNIITDNATKEKQKDTAKVKEGIIKNEQITASLNQIIDKSKSFLFIFLIAVVIAVLTTIIFSFLKKKIK